MSTIGLIGMGELGSAVVRRLIACGHDVIGYDPNPERTNDALGFGARVAASPAAVARASAQIVVLLVRTPEHADHACYGPDGCFTGLAGKVLMVMSTLNPRYVQRLAAEAVSCGGCVADVPSSGGAPAALLGEMALMASGPTEVISQIRPVLEVLGSPAIVGTEPGMAQAAKLITQIPLTVNLTAMLEAVQLGERYGLDAEVLVPVIAKSSGNSFVASNWSFLLNFIEDTHVANIAKDLATVLGDPPDAAEFPVAGAALAALLAPWPVGPHPC
jgi:3-hydroxyisobutyrate dehydrogenase-like beta-hydroxyacid dehydrogenase